MRNSFGRPSRHIGRRLSIAASGRSSAHLFHSWRYGVSKVRSLDSSGPSVEVPPQPPMTLSRPHAARTRSSNSRPMSVNGTETEEPTACQISLVPGAKQNGRVLARDVAIDPFETFLLLRRTDDYAIQQRPTRATRRQPPLSAMLAGGRHALECRESRPQFPNLTTQVVGFHSVVCRTRLDREFS